MEYKQATLNTTMKYGTYFRVGTSSKNHDFGLMQTHFFQLFLGYMRENGLLQPAL